MTLQNGSRTVEFNRHHFRHRNAHEYYPQDDRNIEPMDYMAMMRQQSAQMEGKIDSLTSGIQQLVGAMNKKENKQSTEPKAPAAEPMDYMAMMREQSAQMEGRKETLTSGI